MGAELLVETLDHLDEITGCRSGSRQGDGGPRLSRKMVSLDRRWPPSRWIGACARCSRGLAPRWRRPRGRVKVLSGHIEGERYVPDVVQLPGKKPAPAKQVLGDAPGGRRAHD